MLNDNNTQQDSQSWASLTNANIRAQYTKSLHEWCNPGDVMVDSPSKKQCVLETNPCCIPMQNGL